MSDLPHVSSSDSLLLSLRAPATWMDAPQYLEDITPSFQRKRVKILAQSAPFDFSFGRD